MTQLQHGWTFALSMALAMLIAPQAMAATYTPVGPQTNVALSTVTGGGWTLCYSGAMAISIGNSATAATSACSGDQIMLAARATGSNTLLALAWAPKEDALFDTGRNYGATHLANGTAWYNADSRSWGFAPAGESVYKSSCDTNGGNGRICLHTQSGSGGYRINDIKELNSSYAYEKLVFTSVAAVPEPTTWALMLVGFGLTGAVMRRRASQRATKALA